MIQISDTELLVYQTPSITIQCKSIVSELKGCNFCVINIPCHCTVLTQTNKFLPHVASCDSTNQTVTRLHRINLALLQHFFSEDIVGDILANTIFKQIVDVKIPSFKIYKHKMQNILANDKIIDLSLRQVIKRTKQDTKIYSNLAESLIDGEIQLKSAWPTTNDILTYVAFGLTVFNTIWLMWLFHKFRTLAAALMLLRSAHADSQFYFTKPTTTTETNTVWDNLLQEQVEWDHFALALLIIITVLLGLVIQKIWFNYSINTNVYLEITNGQTCIDIKALNIPLCLSHWHVQPPMVIEDIKVTGTVRPKSTVSLPDFLFTSKINPGSLQVPGIINISYYQAFILRRMLKQSYCAYIFLTHKNIYYPLRVNTSSRPHASGHQQIYPNLLTFEKEQDK